MVYNLPMARTLILPALLAILCCFAPVAGAFQAPALEPVVSIVPRVRPDANAAPASLPQANLRVDSSLVLIPAHVTTPLGASVTTLGRESFQLFEDNVEQRITLFAKDDAAVSIGLLFDISGSMRNKMRKSTEAVTELFKTANADDEFFLVEFSDHPKLVVPFTPDSDDIYQRVAHTRPFGRTALLDAIQVGLTEMKRAHNLRKAIVILSDGGDNRSRYTWREIKTAMAESDVQLYAMGIFDREDPKKLSPEERNGPRLLSELAESTGGRLYEVEDINQLPSISARIGRELRNQYLLGYAPVNATRDGKFRHVRLNLSAPPEMPSLRTFYRRGYYAPAQ